MRNSVSRYFSLGILLSLGLGTGCGGGSSNGGTTGNEQLVGKWDSTACETYALSTGDSSFLKRSLSFTSTDAMLTTMIYNEKGCQTLFGISVFGAKYTVGSASTTLPGASDIDYAITTRTVTPLTNNAVSALSSTINGACGSGNWTLNQAGDVAQIGCPVLGIPSLSACPKELDLIKVDGDNLSTGDRAASDACKTRPTALITQLLVKAK